MQPVCEWPLFCASEKILPHGKYVGSCTHFFYFYFYFFDHRVASTHNHQSGGKWCDREDIEEREREGNFKHGTRESEKALQQL